ncbi:MAG: DUF4340 domain-containing protein [Oscillospiraceae bacterium]
MNGKIKGIIIGGVAVVCLVAAALVLNFTGKSDESSSKTDSSSAASEEDEAISIINSSSEEITSIEISGTQGKYTIARPESGKTLWDIAELKGLNQNVSSEKSLVETASTLSAFKIAEENATDLDKYGLKSPQCEFRVNFTNGKNITLLVGNDTPNTSIKSRYLCEKGQSKVYVVRKYDIDDFLNAKEDYINTTLIETPEEVDNYGKMTVSRPDLDYDIVIQNDNVNKTDKISSQIMVKPIFSYLNGSTSANITHGLWGISADSAVKIFPTDDDFKKYGISNPTATVSYSSSDENYVLKIGNAIYTENEDGKKNSTPTAYYCYLEGINGGDCIWKILADKLPWTTVKPEDIITTLMTYNNINDVNNIKVETNGAVTEYKLTAKDGEFDSATVNGKKVKASEFKNFYQYLLTCPTTEIWYKEPAGEKFMTIEITAADNAKDVLEFYKDNSERKAVVKLNGNTSFRIAIDWTEKFVKNMDALENGGNIVVSY